MRSKLLAVLVVLGMVMAACAAPTPEVIKEEVIVEKEVPVTVEVEKEVLVEKEVVKTVEVEKEVVVEKVVTATPEPGADKRGGTLVLGYYQEPELLAPWIRTQTTAGDAGEFFERGMTIVLPDGTRVPDLVTEVPSVQNGGVSDDGLTITYKLKEGIVWSDGDAFDCEDVKFTWETIMHPDSGAVSTTGYKDMESVTCPDPHTVAVKYAKFYAPYLTVFNGGILPSHIGLDPAKMTEWEYNRNPDPALGAFVLEEWVSGDHMTLVRNEKYEYWATEGKPYLDSIIIRYIESREVGKQLIQTGEIDFLWDLIEADIPEARTWDGVVVSAPPGIGTERLVFNLADPELDAPCKEYLLANPSPHWALGDVRVRQAIQYGIDKNVINDKLLYGLATVGTQEQNLGWAKADIPESEFNPDKARALLEEAGWTDEDGDGIRECHGCPYAEEGKVLKLKYQTTTGNKLREQCQQVVMEMMADIGVEFYIENVPSSELFASYAKGAFRKHGQYDVLMYTTSGGIDPHSFLYGYHGSDKIPCDDNSGSGYNYSRWINAEADAAFEVAGSNPDIEVRKAAYQTVAEQIAAEVPHLYLYNRAGIDLLREEFMGFDSHPWENVTWNNAEWWIKK